MNEVLHDRRAGLASRKDIDVTDRFSLAAVAAGDFQGDHAFNTPQVDSQLLSRCLGRDPLEASFLDAAGLKGMQDVALGFLPEAREPPESADARGRSQGLHVFDPEFLVQHADALRTQAGNTQELD
jgi:hypothetical protein